MFVHVFDTWGVYISLVIVLAKRVYGLFGLIDLCGIFYFYF